MSFKTIRGTVHLKLQIVRMPHVTTKFLIKKIPNHCNYWIESMCNPLDFFANNHKLSFNNLHWFKFLGFPSLRYIVNSQMRESELKQRAWTMNVESHETLKGVPNSETQGSHWLQNIFLPSVLCNWCVSVTCALALWFLVSFVSHGRFACITPSKQKKKESKPFNK